MSDLGPYAPACVKCGGQLIGTKYDRGLDVLRKVCHNCGYDWSVPPHDRQARATNTAPKRARWDPEPEPDPEKREAIDSFAERDE